VTGALQSSDIRAGTRGMQPTVRDIYSLQVRWNIYCRLKKKRRL